ncbi:hypothetical protein BIY29_10225 [Brenneria alni]|uniref:Uncharacterized protein n=1 Tax=Brenneria alni TaxID=71656 RepID=A0A421DNN0_9GAMM|nr:hypothetical protein [Brenneria alni]RLM23668.1 hypothetical protein BIY29_10225 [Brenneria alni]
MGYQTGTANDVSDLLEKLSIFASTLGWTVDKFVSGTSPELYLHNADGYWSFGVTRPSSSYKYALFILGNTGFDNALAWTAQPGSSYTNHGSTSSWFANYRGAGTTELVRGAGPFISYDFFGTAQYLHVIVQITAASFRHFGIGTLNREGNYTGGQYTYGTAYNPFGNSGVDSNPDYNTYPFCDRTVYGDNFSSAVRADALGDSGSSPYWFLFGATLAGIGAIGLGGSVLYNSGTYSRRHPDTMAVATSQSQLGAVIAPVPNAIMVIGADGLWRRLGIVPDIAVCRMMGITSRGQLELNGETWMIVPPIKYMADGRIVGENSHVLGYAYRITP